MRFASGLKYVHRHPKADQGQECRRAWLWQDNATSVSDFFSDLYKWTEDQAKEEQRREIRKTAQQLGPREAQKLLPAGRLNGSPIRLHIGPLRPYEAVTEVRGAAEAVPEEDERSGPIRRDCNPIAQCATETLSGHKSGGFEDRPCALQTG